MNDEERNEMVRLEWERSDSFINEAKSLASNHLLLSLAHSTYYGLFHAICALNIQMNLPAPATHKGLLIKFNADFIRTNLLPPSASRICSIAEQFRSKCDYDGAYRPTIEDLNENLKQVSDLISQLKILCKSIEKSEDESKGYDPWN